VDFVFLIGRNNGVCAKSSVPDLIAQGELKEGTVAELMALSVIAAIK